MKNILLTPNPYRDKNFQTARKAAEILRSVGIQPRISLPFDVDKSFELPKDIHFTRLEKELPHMDLVICFGGDGTILHIAKAATRMGVPILGVNIGTMGFMAELEVTEMDKLKLLAKDEYEINKRMMLDVTVRRQREVVYHDICLNDVVVTKGAVARIIQLGVKCDGVGAMDISGDGVIIATPTGSTAYSLSAGGPLVEPDARNMIITPICAHDVAARSMVTAENREISVSLIRNARRNAYLTVDGGKAFHMNMGDVAIIRKSEMETSLLRLKQRSFYDVVNTKFKRG